MEHPGEPASALLRGWLLRLILGYEATGDRERKQGQSDGAAHERLNSKRCKSCQTLYRFPDGKIYIAPGLISNDIELMKKDWWRGGSAGKEALRRRVAHR